MKSNHLQQLATLGQSIWLDCMRRDLMENGGLRRLIKVDGIRGMTSNLAILEKAISGGYDYDADIRSMALDEMDAAAIYEALTHHDVRTAADEFRPLYDATEGADGYAGIEVNPHLSHDTDGTVAEARRLWAALDRPNVLIKIPATDEGIPAIRQLIGEGINVNVTHLFGLRRYRQAVEAYIAGIEDRLFKSKSIRHVTSVASFFLGGIDTLVDQLLDKIIAQDGGNATLARQIHGCAAIAVAQAAYKIYKETYAGDRFKGLAEWGGRPQRIAWAGTDTKNPDYSDVKYVEALIGPDTISTVTAETLNAYRDHGDPKLRLEHNVENAFHLLGRLNELDIGIDTVTRQIEDDGIDKLTKQSDRVLKALALKTPRYSLEQI